MTELDEVWRGPTPGQALWESWETEHSVFCVATGETHLLSELPAEVLRQLSGSASNVRDLAASLADTCEFDNSEQWQRKIASIILSLHNLELVHKECERA